MKSIIRRLGATIFRFTMLALLALTALYPPGPTRSVAQAQTLAPAHSVYLPLATQPDWASTANLFVDPVNGKDTNRGTQDRPLKTLTKALSKAKAGCIIHLAGGGYGPTASSGETFPATGLVVPSGVTIEGAVDSTGFPTATLVGTGSGIALSFAGDGTVHNLFFGGSGFGINMGATQGRQSFSNIFLGTLTSSSQVFNLNGQIAPASGIALLGTAQASLTGGSLFVNGVPGVLVFGQAQFTMSGSDVTLTSGDAVHVERQAQFTMDGGKIARAANLNCPTGFGVFVDDSAQVTLKNGVALTNLLTALGTGQRSDSKVTLINTKITKEYHSGCVESPSVQTSATASLSFGGSVIAASGGQSQGDIGIESRSFGGLLSTVNLTLKATTITGHKGTGIKLDGNEKVTIDAGQISRNGIGINAQATSANRPTVTMTGTLVASNQVGLHIDSSPFASVPSKLRQTSVIGNVTGIEVGRADNNCFLACVDLGKFGDLGNNTITGNTKTGVLVGFLAVAHALGNTWNPNTQGADASGFYPHIVIDGTSPLAHGTNFDLTDKSSSILL